MARKKTASVTRTKLTRATIIAAAKDLADLRGLEALTMRRLGEQMGVEAMSLYRHVKNKEDLFDGLADLVATEIALPDPTGDWRLEMRARAISARAMLHEHPWAAEVMESRRSPGMATLSYYEAVLATLRNSGFSLAMAAQAYATLDSFIYGFAFQERKLPFDSEADLAELSAQIFKPEVASAFPHLAELARDHVLQPGYAFGDQFEVGLDLILDGLDRAKADPPARPKPRKKKAAKRTAARKR